MTKEEKNDKNNLFVITNQSPYYLSPSDSLGATIMAIGFDGKNYYLWEQAIKTALKVKNKHGFIDGKITKPTVSEGEESTEANAWDMITSWIMNMIDPKLHASTAYVELAHEMWTNIEKQYSVPNVPKKHKLKAEIASCKQGNLEVVQFLSKLMAL